MKMQEVFHCGSILLLEYEVERAADISELTRRSFSGDVWLSYSVPIDVMSADI